MIQQTNKVFVLYADCVHGVQSYDVLDFMADNPDQEFVSVSCFENSLPDLLEGESIVCFIDDLQFKEELERIEEVYGIVKN